MVAKAADTGVKQCLLTFSAHSRSDAGVGAIDEVQGGVKDI